MARLSRIAPEIPVSDLIRSIEYYEQKLGFQLVMTMPAGDYAIVERDDIAVHLFRSQSPRFEPVGLHLFTGGLDELHSELVHRGAQLAQGVEHKPWGNREFRVTDPSGNTLKFTEPLSG